MTPKEKAIELFNKMDKIIYTDQDNWKDQCKACAITAALEVVSVISTYSIDSDCPEESSDEYWNEVLNEINNL